jgi:hypothetical protein
MTNNKHTKKQHYVPRAFLDRWCKSDEFFPIKKPDNFDVKDIVILPKTNSYNFCHENYFYANERGVADDFSQEVESFLTSVEEEIYDLLDDFEDKIHKNIQITYEDRCSLVRVMLFLDTRGKRGFERSDSMVSQLFEHLRNNNNMTDEEIKKLIGTKGDEQIIVKKDGGVQMSTKQHIQQFFENVALVHHIANKDWIINVSKNGDFIVTDTQYSEEYPEYTGVLSRSIYDRTQFFILSPKIVIFIRKPESMTDVRTFLYDENLPISINANYVCDVTNNKNMIDCINATTFDLCKRFGFHHDKKILERTKTYLLNNVK